MEFFIITEVPPRGVPLDGLYGKLYIWEVLDSFFQ
jgi:hypothetical protein